ncbi:MAG TPA: tRNA (adenosine(37)-N6)-dimethylallyltransferase MiaA [Alphaproteobacteria bacterium]|nr:tRNA (adenosine(37)-N6)-dimethylallyltransferase MiaA [Alphaproteobacteria bacterium]
MKLDDKVADAPPVIVIGGPTASGKSALAVDLAEELGGVVINADAMQIYRDLPILTARPGAADCKRAPHRLFGMIDAVDPCSAGRWRELALAAIGQARAEGKRPVVVGGTGLYLKALRDGIDEIPAVSPMIRAQIEARYDAEGGAAFRAVLARDDPQTAKRLPPGDRQRLVRAAAVLEATGRPLSAWQTGATDKAEPALPTQTFVLLPPREALYAACDARFEAMVERGALAETGAFLARGLDPDLPLMKTVGLRELGRHIAGETSLEAAIAEGCRATRRYAKRQYTWFRHQIPDAALYNAQHSESLSIEIFKIIRRSY